MAHTATIGPNNTFQGVAVGIRITIERVEGTCAVAGLVELFSDTADAAEVFEGSVRCDAVSPWTFSGPLPAGRRITATLTDESGSTSGLSSE